jgi:hypothetical protein
MNKTAPDPVEGVQQVSTASAIHIASEEEEFDEEAGVYEESSPPLTTAIEVTNELSIPGQHGHRRTRIYIVIGVVAILITTIVWPVVVFTKGSKEGGVLLPPPPLGNGSHVQDWLGNGTWHDLSERGASPVKRKRLPATLFSQTDQNLPFDNDVLQLTLSNKTYACHVAL